MASSRKAIDEEDRQILLKYIQPLEQLESELEVRARSKDKSERDFAHHCLTLLNVLSTEPALCFFFKKRMAMCQKHGLVARYRCKGCPDYDAWYVSEDSNADNCIYRDEFKL